MEAFAYRYPEGETVEERFLVHRTVFPRDFLDEFGFQTVRSQGRVELCRLELGGLVPVEEGSARRCSASCRRRSRRRPRPCRGRCRGRERQALGVSARVAPIVQPSELEVACRRNNPAPGRTIGPLGSVRQARSIPPLRRIPSERRPLPRNRRMPAIGPSGALRPSGGTLDALDTSRAVHRSRFVSCIGAVVHSAAFGERLAEHSAWGSPIKSLVSRMLRVPRVRVRVSRRGPIRWVIPIGAMAAMLTVAGAGKPATAPGILYVSAAGNDGGRCVQTSPCLSFNRAYQVAKPGQIIQVAGGGYGGQTIDHDPSKGSGPNVILRPAPGATVNVMGELNIRGSNMTFAGTGLGAGFTFGWWHTMIGSRDISFERVNTKGFDHHARRLESPSSADRLVRRPTVMIRRSTQEMTSRTLRTSSLTVSTFTISSEPLLTTTPSVFR